MINLMLLHERTNEWVASQRFDKYYIILTEILSMMDEKSSLLPPRQISPKSRQISPKSRLDTSHYDTSSDDEVSLLDTSTIMTAVVNPWLSRHVRRYLGILIFAALLVTILFFPRRADEGVTKTTLVDEYIFDETCRYDYIIVGGGPSGIVLATLLSGYLPNNSANEKSNLLPVLPKVLLLEAGEHSDATLQRVLTKRRTTKTADTDLISTDPPLTEFDIPLLWSHVASNPEYQWDIGKSKEAGNLNPNVAKLLGGCGIHNAMLYIRATPGDFSERWQLEDKGWDWNEMVKYYDRMAEFLLPMKPGKFDFWGRSWLEACQMNNEAVDFGDEKNDDLIFGDFNNFNKYRNGCGVFFFNIMDGIRNSVASGMLGKALKMNENRPPNKRLNNLVVVTGATVTKVQFTESNEEGKKSTANAVVFVDVDGVKREARVRPGAEGRGKRVGGSIILSAGSIMSPQILAASGIGPRGEVSNLVNVGRNLQDHPAVPLVFETTSSTGAAFHGSESEFLFYRNQIIHNATDFGSLGTAGFTAGAFFSSPHNNGTDPDIQITVFPAISSEPHVLEFDDFLYRPNEILVTVALLKPDARYVLSPRLTKPYIPDIYVDQTINNGSYFSERDKLILAYGISKVREIFGQKPIKSMVVREIQPGQSIVGEEAVVDYVESNHYPNSHWVGTCALGDVVDEKFRVKGVDQLFVVDASVMPKITNGNVHSTVCAIALKAADMFIRSENSKF